MIGPIGHLSILAGLSGQALGAGAERILFFRLNGNLAEPDTQFTGVVPAVLAISALCLRLIEQPGQALAKRSEFPGPARSVETG